MQISETLRKSIKHGLELLGVLIVTFVIDYYLGTIAPQLPQTPTFAIIAALLGSLLKWLRANPKIPIKDYVNEPIGRTRS